MNREALARQLGTQRTRIFNGKGRAAEVDPGLDGNPAVSLVFLGRYI
jgi:hypothetical protein